MRRPNHSAFTTFFKSIATSVRKFFTKKQKKSNDQRYREMRESMGLPYEPLQSSDGNERGRRVTSGWGYKDDPPPLTEYESRP